MSSYLALRYVAVPNLSWIEERKIISNPPIIDNQGKEPVNDYLEIIENIKKTTEQYKNKKIGLLLSSGIDSAILAALLPPHVKAYTIKFKSKKSIDESVQAKKISNHLKINHKIISLGWDDYERSIDKLMIHKKAPLHQAELAIYHGALAAKKDGVDTLFTGGAADSMFGGMSNLLAKDWNFDDFIQRYNYLDPKLILKNPSDVSDVYKKYKLGDSINTQIFLKDIFGSSTVQMFKNAIEAAGCKMVAPFSKIYPKTGLNLQRIRNGEPKYMLKDLYRELYPDIAPIDRMPFPRPMDDWLSDWQDLHRIEFRNDIKVNALTGDQKWLIYCLQRFLDLIEKDKL